MGKDKFLVIALALQCQALAPKLDSRMRRENSVAQKPDASSELAPPRPPPRTRVRRAVASLIH